MRTKTATYHKSKIADHAAIQLRVAEAGAGIDYARRALADLGKTGEITQRLQQLFFDAIRGKNDKYSHWLTPVKPQTSGQPADRQGVKVERVP